MASPADIVARVRVYDPLIVGAASTYHLDAALVAAVCAHESLGNPYAIRVERGFWRRYGAAVAAFARRSVSRHDDRWVQYPDLASCSYGLMQVMYPTALELGAVLRYPTELCDPATNLDVGCRMLRVRCFDRVPAGTVPAARTRAALLRYNGGGDAGYPDRVLAWLPEFGGRIDV